MPSRPLRFAAFLFLSCSMVIAQTAPVAGLRNNTPNIHAFTNARIVTAPGVVIQKGILVIRDGMIEAVGSTIQPPADARIWNMDGLTLYPGFIDLASDYGIQKPQQQRSGDSYDSNPPSTSQEKSKGIAHWNTKMNADRDASQEFVFDAKSAEKLRSQGFTLVLTSLQRGIFRGSTTLVSLGEGPASDLILKRKVTQTICFDQSGGFSSGYPNSLMGMIAFIRQCWMDADWYRRAQESYTKNSAQPRPETNPGLAALADALQTKQPVIFDASDDISTLRVIKIAKEFSLPGWIRGSGYEYRRLEAIASAKMPIIIPVNFPEPPAVETPEGALNIALEKLRHWDAAPENPGRCAKTGIAIALTSSQLKDAGTFLQQLRKAVDRGLEPDAALAALTTTPAKLIGMEKQLGTLEKGKNANFFVTSGDLFAEKTVIRETWIDGRRFELKTPPISDVRGTWTISSSIAPNRKDTVRFKGEAEKPSGTFSITGRSLSLSGVSYTAGRIAFLFEGDSAGYAGRFRLSGSVSEKDIYGIGELPDGSRFMWSAEKADSAPAEADSIKPKKIQMASFEEVYPPGEFGRAKQPDQPSHILVRNATIWTQGTEGKMIGADLLVEKGKIKQVGRNLSAPKDAIMIDATGKHVTPGIIDCHSHTAAEDANEGGQAITCEARIEDVIDPNDIWIYRQLAGGTTMANVLHGSANPIGGTNSILKWRWGSLPGDLIFSNAPPGIKFALGENVKQSNYMPGGRPSNRYPQTRMGVDQLIRDRFKAALDYEQSSKEWEKDKSKIPPRRDLELETLLETVKGKREIHAHAYRQDEIIMLLRIAEDFGIHVATYQHVLEGYKVADVLAKHGAGGSSFSDWWGYKVEAYDAIPGNGPLMDQQGVVVSYNSDDSELATRLNWEAAKAIPFGISEERALNFVTINPAKQLKIDTWVGSLESGKDGDFVIWSGNPLSTYTHCEQTWLDGRRYFDVQEDQQLRIQSQKERAALIQKILADKKETPSSPGGPGSRSPRPKQALELEVDHD